MWARTIRLHQRVDSQLRQHGGHPGRRRLKLWGNAVCRDRKGGKAQIGYWGLELARRLVENHKMPICIINGAVGGSRIDQHQRNPSRPEDAVTIYGRLLVARAAGETHARHSRGPLASGRKRSGCGWPDRTLWLGNLFDLLRRSVGRLETGLPQHPTLLPLPDLAQSLFDGHQRLR